MPLKFGLRRHLSKWHRRGAKRSGPRKRAKYQLPASPEACAWARRLHPEFNKERHVPSEIEHKYLVLKEAWKPSTSGVLYRQAICHPLKNAWFEFGSQETEHI